jgi:hypothetical protein
MTLPLCKHSHKYKRHQTQINITEVSGYYEASFGHWGPTWSRIFHEFLHFQQNSRPTRLTQVLHSFALGEIRCKINQASVTMSNDILVVICSSAPQHQDYDSIHCWRVAWLKVPHRQKPSIAWPWRSQTQHTKVLEVELANCWIKKVSISSDMFSIRHSTNVMPKHLFLRCPLLVDCLSQPLHLLIRGSMISIRYTFSWVWAPPFKLAREPPFQTSSSDINDFR